ncbi:hypothetical protein CPB84DRAFT_1843649 [Gymnopilus junonius]|uniref:Uncharacterized protein n=1 Tax=Gymnopilus junonius TaxID=109634 RepID=A0A9P5TQY3_GYMJU|nr:hypothetical protein CPB84DRAFT_1843649 [Gymnopilus junonius]
MKTPSEAYTFAFAPLFSQGVIWAMTLYKKINGFGGYGVGINPSITTLMFRDGLIAFLLISSVIIICLSYSVYVHDLQNTVWSILVTILSIWGGRIVMNMQRLKVSPIPPQAELTSYIEDSSANTTINFLHESEEDEANGIGAEFPM